MNVSRLSYQVIAWAAVVGLCIPASWAMADQPSRPQSDRPADVAEPAFRIGDVALGEGGLLIGRVSDAQMRPIAGTEITIHSGGEGVAVTRTDDGGVFAVAGLRGGVHQVATSDILETCRLWAPGTAPPRAAESLHIVSGQGIVRGQWGAPPAANNFVQQAKVLATNPFVVGGVVAAAIAIPVAIHNADRDRRPSS